MEARRTEPNTTRRDLELETIAELIEGKRLIHCHSYRQDEILAFLRVMEDFGACAKEIGPMLRATAVPFDSPHWTPYPSDD